MKTEVFDQARARVVAPDTDDDLPVVNAEQMQPELEWIAMTLSKPSFTDRNGPLYAVNRAWSHRLMELYSLYMAGEMPADAAATFQRVVAGNDVLRNYLAPLGMVWGTRFQDEALEMGRVELEASYQRLMERAGPSSRAMGG